MSLNSIVNFWHVSKQRTHTNKINLLKIVKEKKKERRKSIHQQLL